MLFHLKVISSRSSENFLSNSSHCVNSTDNPSLMDFSTQIDWTGRVEGDSGHVIGRVIDAPTTGTRWGARVVCRFVNTAQACKKKCNVSIELNMPLAALCAGMCHDVSVSHLNSHKEGQTGESLYETQKWNSSFP